jgi:hypothetical protein
MDGVLLPSLVPEMVESGLQASGSVQFSLRRSLGQCLMTLGGGLWALITLLARYLWGAKFFSSVPCRNDQKCTCLFSVLELCRPAV